MSEKEETQKQEVPAEGEQAKEKPQEKAEAEPSTDEPSSKSVLEEAKETVKEMHKKNKEFEALLDRQEKQFAENRLEGKGFAAQPPMKEPTEDEKWAKRAKKRYEGTGMDPTD